MIRTSVVELTTIPAVAYRQKLPAGGSGVTICRYGEKQCGVASVSTRSGKAIPADNTPPELYPAEAFEEALALTRGLPYKRLGKVTVLKKSFKENCLLEQEFIWDKNQTVAQYLHSVDKELTIVAFKRFTLRAE